MSIPEETPQQQEQRLQRILKQVEERLRQGLPNPYQPLEKTEQEVYDIGEDLRHIIEKETLVDGTEKQSMCARWLPCSCGKPARYVDVRSRQLVTRNGVQSLWRAYYHCRACGKGFCPRDALWQVQGQTLSVGVRALLARFASFLPFAPAARELEATCGIRVSANTVRRHSETLGTQLAADWARAQQQLWAHPDQPSRKRPLCLHLTLDGVLIRVDKEWKEVKLACAYEHTPQEAVGKAQYSASLVSSQAFGKRARTLAHQAGADACPQMAVVADGADWIWQEMGKYFPTRTQILDYYHALQHLWEVGHARFGKDMAVAQSWIDCQQERLLEDRVVEVIADIGQWGARTKEQQVIRRRVLGYLYTHQARMRYKRFRARMRYKRFRTRMRYKRFRTQGYHIGSGVVEAACKNVVQARFKGVGMRWSAAGAEALLQLRAAWCSSDYTDFRDLARRA
jgi:hypothetical protein